MTETLVRGYPGMKAMDFPRHDSLQLLYGFLQAAGATGKALAVLQSAKDLPVLQDGPPPGGFPSVRYARRVPSTGPTGFTLFTVGAAVMAFGFYKVGETNQHRRACKAEKLAARATLFPLLQAEEDRRFVKYRKQMLEEEKLIMKDVPGWVPGANVYSKRWMAPAAPVGVWGGSV